MVNLLENIVNGYGEERTEHSTFLFFDIDY